MFFATALVPRGTIGLMKKLDFIFFDAGGGHRAAANALRQVMVVGPKWIIKTSSGKIARSANREKYLEAVARMQAGDQPG